MHTDINGTNRIKERLKAVTDRPENQFCCECGDRKPTWASIIEPPSDMIREQLNKPMGAMCCYYCSGSHRRLGVRICIVQSVTLDDCKLPEY